jgi:diguanylate cyclase (GGDEF)-like protein
MVPLAGRLSSNWDFALATAERPRALWARTQRALKRFLNGAPEDALLATASVDRTQAHLAVMVMLLLPLCFGWLLVGAIGRAAIFFSLFSGLIVAVQLEASARLRANPLSVLGAGILYAVSLSGVAWELLGPAALRVDPAHALTVVVAALCALATRSDPRLCALASGAGVLSIGGLHAYGTSAGAGTAPALITAASAGLASTLAAARGREIQRLSILDGASGALHAAAFERCLRNAFAPAQGEARPITLARIEFSALRAIRETHGPALADALLRWLAGELADRFRTTDLLGRTGGDEFSLALLDTDHPGVERRLERIREEFDTIELSRGGLREPIALQIVFGVAARPREARDASSLRKLAEQRLALARWRTRKSA